ncbi:hypothetical protein [Archangium sp.]|uniref:hypothetical protein n=1 Tax=Archangium sp. TaxID=1872627 RepID=UPI00286C05BA|nr:hypothetical protein [Archangium sp.]
MERVREAPAPPEESPLSLLQPPPELVREARPLLEQLASLREPGVTTAQVDVFLAGLAAPRPSHEPPRVRADLMLDVLEDEWLCELTGSTGRRAGQVALEALLGLGYPYALEVTPEMLAQARRSPPVPFPFRPVLGLGLAGLNALLPLGVGVGLTELPPPGLLPESFFRLFASTPFLSLRLELWPAFSLALLGPPLLSVLADGFKRPSLKRLSHALQWLGVGLAVWGAALWGREAPASAVLALFTALLSLLTLHCLTPPKAPES